MGPKKAWSLLTIRGIAGVLGSECLWISFFLFL